jgi:hypothetical protein
VTAHRRFDDAGSCDALSGYAVGLEETASAVRVSLADVAWVERSWKGRGVQ